MAIRLLSLAVFAAVSVVATGDASQQSALTSQQQYENASTDAKALATSLESKVQRLRSLAHDDARIDALGASILRKANHTSPTRQDIENVRHVERQEKSEMRSLRHNAKKAARSAKHWAREVERDQRHAGNVPEHVYEGDFGRREEWSESLADHVENLGDEGSNHIETVYQRIEHRFESASDRAQDAEEAEKKQQAQQRQEKPDREAAAEKAPTQKPASGKVVKPEEEASVEQLAEQKALAAPLPAAPVLAEKAAPEKTVAALSVGANTRGGADVAAQVLASTSPNADTSIPVVLFMCASFALLAAVMRAYLRDPTQETQDWETYEVLA